MFARIVAVGTAALAVAAFTTTVLGTTASAEDSAPRIEINSGSVFLSGFDHGGFTRSGDGSIRVTEGTRPVAELPSTFTLDGNVHRLDSRIGDGGSTLTLTPVLAAHPVASAMENQLALDDFATTMRRGPVIGTVIGTVVGALVGAIVGASTCVVVGPACLATVPAAIVAFARAGGVAGTLLVGGGALAVGLWNYLTVLQAPPGQSPYAGQGGLLDPNGTGVPDSQLRLPSGSAKGFRGGSSSGSGG